jgi:succinyl-diaminopimelate desuccinylase
MTLDATGQAVLDLTKELIGARSVTPDDAGCQDILSARLKPLGFDVEFINSGQVRNLWASRTTGDGPHLVFAGHTDVVPTGPLGQWSSDPFEPVVREGWLFGRGAADMKSGLAAMIVALENAEPTAGTISLLITSDEEGVATEGTKFVIKQLAKRKIRPDYCVVGEPSSGSRLGDVVRNGRRGSLNGQVRIIGVQGHVAYPDQVKNPIHLAAPMLAELTQRTWDDGNSYFPPTSLQISNINAGTGATNVVPGELELSLNFRFNTNYTSSQLIKEVEATFVRWALEYECNWVLSGNPFLTPSGHFTDSINTAISNVTGHGTQLSTGGGTSDGRFIAPWDGEHRVDVVELGPRNATIHKIDECTPIDELGPLSEIYRQILEMVLS